MPFSRKKIEEKNGHDDEVQFGHQLLLPESQEHELIEGDTQRNETCEETDKVHAVVCPNVVPQSQPENIPTATRTQLPRDPQARSAQEHPPQNRS